MAYLIAALMGVVVLVFLGAAMVAVDRASQAVRKEPGLPAVLLLLVVVVVLALAYAPH
jgi:hypothetical protein